MKIFSLLLCLSLLSSCSQKPVPWNGPTLIQPRVHLTIEQLLQDSTFVLMDMSFFAKPDWADEAVHSLSGSVSFDDTKLIFQKDKGQDLGEDIFPGVSLDFITHEGDLIPLIKAHIVTREHSKSYWDIFVGTGAAWQEKEDDGWSRASFPLTLTDRYMGQAINCVATFAYTPDVISNIYVQCSQETAHLAYGQLRDFRTTLVAKYQHKRFPDSVQIVEKHLQFQSQRFPVSPLSAIDVHQEIADEFERPRYTYAPVSLGAIWLNEKLYSHPPLTRHGLYPYPVEMRHAVNSVTKSLAGSLSLLYFAQRYGEDIFDELITDYVPELADHPGWKGVTFSHTLSMVTGTVGSENSEHFGEILVMPRTTTEAITNIATLGDDVGMPGEKFNYGPTNTFVLSYALQKYVEQKERQKIGYWDLVKESVLIPLGAEYFTVRHTIETDGTKGIPLLSYGAFPTLDEAAKIAVLLSNEGNFQGQQLLHREKTKEALGRSTKTAYSTNNDFRGSGYQHGFWSKSVSKGECEVDVRYMLGYGENYVAFLPSKAIIFAFMDEHDLDFDALVQSVEKIRSSCREE
jgi:CubicO group peptidase (beta-lactamase class C family)